MSNKVILYLISDSVGETAQKIISAVAAQFPEVDFSEIKKFPFTKDSDTLKGLLQDALADRGIVVTTLVDKKLVAEVRDFCEKTSLPHIDYMTPLSDMISAETGIEPIERPGALHRLDQEYFSRVAAIEFAVRNDDGKDPRSFREADIVILGVSRTSKTPLSMYLANKKYKVANLPLIPEAEIPEELFQIDSKKIVGLMAKYDTLAKIRKSRLKSLGLHLDSTYSDKKRIQEELDYAHNIFEQLNVIPIYVDNKAIEETASVIEEMFMR